MRALPPPSREPSVALALDLCDRLLAEHLSALEDRFGARALGLADLPPLTGDAIEPGQLKVAPALFWASEVEAAGLLDTVDALARGVFDGSVIEPMGPVVNELVAWWRGREERFNPRERRALYSHLFGGEGSPDPNQAFPAQLDRLVRALDGLGRLPRGEDTAHLEVAAQGAARELAADLSERTAGVAAFAARDITAQIRSALSILRDPSLSRAFGGGGPFTLVQRLAPRLLGRAVSPSRHLSRAEAGLMLLSWVARQAAAFGEDGFRVGRDDAVVHAAASFLAAGGGD